jgi:hypothetical protein
LSCCDFSNRKFSSLKVKGKTLFFLVLLLLWQAKTSYSTHLEDISLDSWVYPVLEQLHTAGLLSDLHKNIKPYPTEKIVSSLKDIQQKIQAGKLKLDEDQIWLISKLEQKFKYELEEPSCHGSKVKYGIDPLFFLYREKDSTSFRFKLRFEGGVELNNKFLLKQKAIIDNQSDRETDYYAKKWKKNLIGTTDEAYGLINLKYLKFFFGKEALAWGPSLRDNLLLSNHFPPLDMLKLQTEIGSFQLIYFTTILDQMELSDRNIAKRYFSAHRLNWRSNFGLEMGLSEMILYGGVNRNIEPHYLNPLLPYYAEQFNHDENDNPLWSIDFNLAFKSKELYGELLIDDFQYDFKTEPQQTGFQLGINWHKPFKLKKTFLNLEYTKINRWVYGGHLPWNIYTYHKVGMGSFLGPDADDIFLNILYHLNRDLSFSISAEYKRKGEGRIDEVQEMAVPFPEKFPSGTVEYTKRTNISSYYQPNSNLQIKIWLDYQNVKNYLNLRNNHKDLYEVGLELNWTFLRESFFNWKE